MMMNLIEVIRRGERKLGFGLPAVGWIRALRVSASVFILQRKERGKPVYVRSGQIFV